MPKVDVYRLLLPMPWTINLLLVIHSCYSVQQNHQVVYELEMSGEMMSNVKHYLNIENVATIEFGDLY